MWFQYSQSWIFPVGLVGLGLLSTTEGWTRWPPGLFQPKIVLSFNLSFNVFNKTVLSSWLELVSDFLLVHTISWNIYFWKKRNPLRLNEFICKSRRKSCLIPNFFYVFLQWHTLKLNYRMPSEHAWNVCEYCGFWLQFNSKAKCKSVDLQRTHVQTIPTKPSQVHAAVPSVLMQALSALHAASPVTAPGCRRNSVPGLGHGCQCHENLLAGGKQNAT